MVTLFSASEVSAKSKFFEALDKPDTLHAAAHTGLSYITVHSTQAVCTAIASSDHKLGCTILGVAVAGAAGAFKEIAVDKGESNKRHAMGYIQDAAGIGAAVTFISLTW